MLRTLIEDLRVGNDSRKTLALLRAQMKDKSVLSDAKEALKSFDGWEKLLQSDDAKTRKNAALLIGDLGFSDCKEQLFRAYEAETVLFVRSAYLTALIGMDISEYKDALQNRYEDLLTMQESSQDAKHLREERMALQKLLGTDAESKKHSFCGLKRERRILLLTHPSYREVTMNELTAREKKIVAPGVLVRTSNIKNLTDNRTFREMLFPLSVGYLPSDDPERAAKELIASDLLPFLEESHDGDGAFFFRVDIHSRMPLSEKSAYAKKLSAVLERESGKKLINSTSGYEIELRLTEKKDGTFQPFLRLITIPMSRFAYRKNSVAATMKPYLAALLVRLASPYLKEHAQVIDPFCGVGTLLVERLAFRRAGMTFGIDTFGEAICGARENTKAAGFEVNYIHRDYFDFTHDYLFDEIITDMPKRGKKTKAEWDYFYDQFFEKSMSILKDDGVMVLYSDEAAFVKKQIRRHERLKLETEYPINDRESSYLYIIRARSN